MRRVLSFICKITGAVTLLTLAAAVLLFLTASSWLPVQGEPRQADYIVVLAGSPARALYAADLYNQGYAPRVLVSKPWRDDVLRRLEALDVPYTFDEEVNVQTLLAKGVPRSAIGIFGAANMSTAQEAMVLQQRFAGTAERLLVVTSPYHVRRTRMIFNDLLPCCEHQIVGTPYEPFADKWWQDRQSARALVLESAKFIFYLSGGRFVSSQQSPEPKKP